jgi:diguanylate cyclase (GGDEF)-like protein
MKHFNLATDLFMKTTPTPMYQNETDHGMSDIQNNLRTLESRSLWAWGNTVVIILSLTATIVALSVSLYTRGGRTIYGLDLKLAVRALVLLILVFTGQMIYQHLRLRKIQHTLAEQQIQAEVFRRLSMYDPLTGLYNRRYAEQRLRSEMARSERRGLSLIVVLLDLDNFEQINDEHGKQAGDHVLREFAKHLSAYTRGSDLAARWGGDEFFLMLLDCEAKQLPQVLSRIGEFQVECQGKTLPITFSAGWKAYEPGAEHAELIMEADRLLKERKAKAKTGSSPAATPA